MPEIAFLGGVSLPYLAHESNKTEYMGADLRFALSHTLSDRFSLGYNLGAVWDGESTVPAGYYSLALGIGITDYLGAFIESYGLLSEDMEHYIDFGFIGLILPDFQLDVSGGFGINQDAADMFVSAGLSYRIPR